MRFLFTSYYPYAIAVAFLTFLFWMKVPRKGVFLSRALIALLIATFLAHVNRIFDLSLSLAMLRPWTLLITLPLLVVLVVSMVTLRFHTTFDILGAIPLVLIVYGIIHKYWRLEPERVAEVRARS
jgi:hypothetical protein